MGLYVKSPGNCFNFLLHLGEHHSLLNHLGRGNLPKTPNLLPRKYGALPKGNTPSLFTGLKGSVFYHKFFLKLAHISFHIPTHSLSAHKPKARIEESICQQYNCIRVTIYFLRKPQRRENTDQSLFIPSLHTCCTVEDSIVN